MTMKVAAGSIISFGIGATVWLVLVGLMTLTAKATYLVMRFSWNIL